VSYGRFVTLEGGEGAGKSTQAKLLVDALGAAGIPALATREPGGTPAAEEIRALLVTGEPDRWDAIAETLLHFAARRQHVVDRVAPTLARGTWVVSDRFADSTLAYQGYAQGVGRAVVEAIRQATLGELVPDLTLVLDLPAELGLHRARQRADGVSRYERLPIDRHRALRDAFLDIARREPERCRVVDATGDVASVQAAIRAVVAGRFGIAL
jgi:dTMP kinase